MSANMLRTMSTPEPNARGESAASPAEPPPTLRGRVVLLRPPTASDVEPLAEILAEPAVARWWGGRDADWVRRELVGAEPGWVIVVDEGVVGWLQYTEETEPEYRHVGLDIFLTTALHGRGVAREAIRLAIRHFIERGHHRFTIDPAADNERAIRAYAALGFKPVGVMRRYERGPDGSWHDGLLMDLLAEELAPD
jgi:aminoglycoside 6'-N-acetyltransferase